MAIEREDEAGEAKVLAKIEKFNEANGWNAITGEKIIQSLKKRAKDRALANEMHGLKVNPKFAELARQETRYANDDDDEE